MLSDKIWRALTDTLYSFTLVPYIYNHKYRTHKYADNVDEKFGLIPQRQNTKPCLLIHAVSVGEVIAAGPLISEFSRRRPGWEIRLTVSTATGREVALKHYPELTVTFFPLDLSIWVKRFFKRLHPSAVILMELEIWPNFLSLCQEYAIPVIVANGRITDKSAEQYRKFKNLPVLKRMLNIPTYWLAQNQTYAERFRSIGIAAEKIQILGSVKYDTIPTELSPQIRAKYRSLFKTGVDTTLIIAGSTHSPEEDIVLKAFQRIRKRYPSTQLALVPRHPHRFAEVYEQSLHFGDCRRLSELEENNSTASADIILVDKMGILSELYNAADLVFIGGSFIEHGGQNMLETCGLGIPTIIGPSYYNFSEAVTILKAAGGIIISTQPENLAADMLQILQAPDAAAAIGVKGRAALLAHKGCTKKTIDKLEELLG